MISVVPLEDDEELLALSGLPVLADLLDNLQELGEIQAVLGFRFRLVDNRLHHRPLPLRLRHQSEVLHQEEDLCRTQMAALVGVVLEEHVMQMNDVTPEGFEHVVVEHEEVLDLVLPASHRAQQLLPAAVHDRLEAGQVHLVAAIGGLVPHLPRIQARHSHHGKALPSGEEAGSVGIELVQQVELPSQLAVPHLREASPHTRDNLQGKLVQVDAVALLRTDPPHGRLLVGPRAAKADLPAATCRF
mmetsp:Transcript_2924/g.8409  ORF Transcript_2924/g.8409 Transcript_2924/m.8409 type:complete len:245 (+) Transcript_2924:889-1623(+)